MVLAANHGDDERQRADAYYSEAGLNRFALEVQQNGAYRDQHSTDEEAVGVVP